MDNFEKTDQYWRYKPVLWCSVACLFSFFLWASLTKIDERVRATGKIVPAGSSQIIQHLEGGIINEILVKEGQRVDKGEILFYIKNQRADSEAEELKIVLSALQLKKMRLTAQLDQSKELAFTPELEEEYKKIALSERAIYEARQAEFKQNIQSLEQRLRQKILKLNELETTVESLKKELEVAQEQLDIKIRLRKKGAVSRAQYLDNLSTVRNFETKIQSSTKEKPIVKSEISEITNLIEKEKQRYFSEASEDLNEVETEIKKVTERTRSYEDEVYRTAIKSPVEGIVNKIDINTIGGVIQPGGRIAEIIPIKGDMIIEGRISTNDRGKVWPGLKTVAKITAYDYTIYGGVEGQLNYISANSFIDNQNQEYYEIKASLDQTNFSDEQPIYPGMTAEVNIVVGNISLMYSLLKPFWNIRNNALREK